MSDGAKIPDEIRAEAEDGNITGWITFNDGEEAGVPTQAVIDYIAQGGGGLLGREAVEDSPMGGGLTRIDIHIEAVDGISEFEFDEGTSVPLALGASMDGLDASVPYYVLFEQDESGEYTNDPLKTLLWTCHTDALLTDNAEEWEIERVALSDLNGTPATIDSTTLASCTLEDGTERVLTLGDFGLDPEKLVTFYNTAAERRVTLGDLLGGLVILRASLGVAMQMKERRNAPMVIRAGKHFTEGMSATSKRGTFEHDNGGAFVMAGDLMISADKAEALSLTVGEKKILAYLNHLATVSGYGYEPERNCIVRTSVDEILEKRGLELTRKNRERARRDIRTLARQAWEFEDTKTHEWVRVPLAGGAARIRRGGAVEFTISADYMRLVLNPKAGMVPIDPLLLQTNDKRNPNAYLIGYKLTTHTYQNYGQANQSTLSVERLLAFVESIPKPEEVTAQNYTQRIIEPLERDLNALIECGVLEWWDYSHTKGAPLTDAEQAQRLGADGEDKALPYDVAIKANIQWQFSHDYAEHMEKVLEAREKKRAEALAARRQKEESDKRMQRRKERRIADKLADREIAEADRGENAPSK